MSLKSLFWRLFGPVLVIVIVAAVAMMFIIPSSIKAGAIKDAIASAQNTVQQFKTLRAYYTKNVVAPVLSDSNLKPHYDHKQSGRIPLPATMIHELSDELKKKGMSVRLYSQYPFPNRSQRSLGDFERNAWEFLLQNPKQVFSETTQIDGKASLRVAIADTMAAQACVDCHNSHPETPRKGWKLGDVRGVLEVAIPIEDKIAMSYEIGTNVVLILIGVLVIICVTLLWVYQRFVSARLEGFSDSIEQMSRGDLTARLDDKGSDEFAETARTFNQFGDKLLNSMRTFREQSELLNMAAADLAGISDRSLGTMEQQKRERGTVVESLEQTSTVVSDVAQSASSAAMNANSADTAAKTGLSDVNNTIGAIQQLVGEIETATQVINQLEEDSVSIGSVLDVIRGIAEQTNLLALNAAIEAARAGEQGRGFAVVADEVRTLASRTQSSTEEIQVVIERVQEGARKAVAAIESGNSGAAGSMEQAQQAGKSLDEIASEVASISDMNNQIASAAEELSVNTRHIIDVVTQVARVAEQSSHTAQEVASQSEGLNALASNLLENVNQFKVN
nr:methyl-accepting chemotaxis protein [Pleionea sp. CnH1-48]